jgi:hypothetical protein
MEDMAYLAARYGKTQNQKEIPKAAGYQNFPQTSRPFIARQRLKCDVSALDGHVKSGVPQRLSFGKCLNPSFPFHSLHRYAVFGTNLLR